MVGGGMRTMISGCFCVTVTLGWACCTTTCGGFAAPGPLGGATRACGGALGPAGAGPVAGPCAGAGGDAGRPLDVTVGRPVGPDALPGVPTWFDCVLKESGFASLTRRSVSR